MSDQPLKTPPPGPLPFATRIPSRSPEWKFHTSKGAASNALAIKRSYRYVDGTRPFLYGELWEMDPLNFGQWTLVRVQGEQSPV
ncbi:hypothetical protein ACXJJ3_32855 [Kribbella sp. WER1]